MRPILLLALLLMTACQAFVIPVPIALGSGDDACGASGYQGLVGEPLAAVTLPADLDARIIEPDSAVTMEFRSDRLNIYVGRDGRVDRVSCG